MRYEAPGTSTLPAEVTNISKHGFWLLLEERDHSIPGDLDRFVGGTGRHVVESNSEMAHDVAS